MPYLGGNMLSKIFYTALEADILRIVIMNTEPMSSCVQIISRIIKQGAAIGRIKQCLLKIYGRNFEIF